MVPNGWERTSFGMLAEFRNGLNFTKSDQGEAIKIVGVADFKDHSSLSSLDNLGVISVSNTVKDNDLIKSGDVLYVRSNGNKDLIGRCLFFPEVTEKLSFSGFTIRGRITSKIILPNYLALLSRSEIVKQQFLKNGGGTNISNLSQQILNDIVVPLPAIEEQRKIAKILSTWDKAITTTEKLIETSKQQKKALIQQLLTGKKRLVNPETGKAFQGEWEEFRLGCLFTERVETKRGDLPLLSITSNDGVVYQKDTGRKNTSNDDKSKYRRICVNDIGYNTMRMWQGRSSISDKEGIVSPAYTILVPQNNVIPVYGAYLFKLPQLVHVFERNSQGLVSDTWNLKYPHFAKIKWIFPCCEEQQKIASVLTTADKEIKVLDQKLTHFKQEKKALMQQLLTGKRRVKVNEMEVA
ncbi:restriction endonuclease subunit S [Vibrio cyclitrophicus]